MDNGRKPIAPIPKRVNSHNVKFEFSRCFEEVTTKSPEHLDDVGLNPFDRTTINLDREYNDFRKECQDQEEIERASNEIFKILKSSDDLELLSTLSNSSSDDGLRKPVPRQSNPFLRNFEEPSIHNSQFYSKAEAI
jgi:hypothetical protein